MAGKLIIRQNPTTMDVAYAFEMAEQVLNYMKKQHPDVEVLLEIETNVLPKTSQMLKALGEDHA